MSIIEQIKADPRVESVWDEGEDGWWAILKEGWQWDGVHGLHERSPRALLKVLRHAVRPCSCEDCRKV